MSVPKVYVPQYITQFSSTHETSAEIALAIFEIANEGDEDRMWREPEPHELEAVMKRAWEFADEDVSELHWGSQTFKREQRPHLKPEAKP